MTAQDHLSADSQAWIGEEYRVSWTLPQNVTNVTVRIEGGTGTILYRFFAEQRFGSTSEVVTGEWGSSGNVILRWDNRTGNQTTNNEEQRSFRVLCSAICQQAILSEMAGTYVAITAASIFVAVLLVAHGQVVYARRGGQSPWTETLALAFKSKIARDPLYRTKTDPLGILPPAMRQDWTEMREAVEEIVKIKVASAKVWSRMRWFVGRVHRLEEDAKKMGLLKQPTPANPDSSMKTPEVAAISEVPENPGPPKRKPGRPAKPKPVTAAAAMKKWEEQGGIRVVKANPGPKPKGRRS